MPKEIIKSSKKGRPTTAAERHAQYDFYTKKGQFYCVEKSTSNRAKCRGCNAIIPMHQVRVRHIVCGNKCFKTPRSAMSAAIRDTCGRWHLTCFMKAAVENDNAGFVFTNSEWKPLAGTDQLAGFSNLSKEHQVLVEKELQLALERNM